MTHANIFTVLLKKGTSILTSGNACAVSALYETGLFHNSLFNLTRLKNIVTSNENNEKNNTLSYTQKQNIQFWKSADLSKIEKRVDVITEYYSTVKSYTTKEETRKRHNIASGSQNKIAKQELEEKQQYNKALEDSKKRLSVKSGKKAIITHKIINKPFYMTIDNSFTFDKLVCLENRIIANINNELNNTSTRLQYIEFWNTCDLKKVYRRKTLENTIKQANNRTAKKIISNAISENDNTFFEIPDTKKVYANPDYKKASDNVFLDIAINTKLADKLVYCALSSLYRQSGDSTYTELLYGENKPINKEDLTQELYLHLVEKALSGEYFVNDDNTLEFDIIACFRIIRNYLYQNKQKHDKYKTIALQGTLEDEVDIPYIEQSIENINNDFWCALSGFVFGYGGNNDTLHIVEDIIVALYHGYKKTVIAKSLNISPSNVSNYIKRYIIPFIAYHVENHTTGENDRLCKTVKAREKTVIRKNGTYKVATITTL